MTFRNLVLAESRRLFARRVTFVMMAAIAGIMTVIALGFALTSTQPSAAERAAAEEVAAEARVTWTANRNECLDIERGVKPKSPGRQYPPNCDYGDEPTAEDILDYGFSFRREWPELYYTAAVILGLFGFVIGASFVGAEWTSGGMTNLLLWRPKRFEVLGAKLMAALGGVLAMSIAYMVVWTAAFLAVGATSGTIGQLTAAHLGSLLLTFVRVVLLGVVGAALGFAIASIGRHTAMALGVGIAYLLVYELGTTIMLGVMGTLHGERFRLSTYVIAWLGKRYEIGPQYECGPTGCFDVQPYFVGWAEGGLALGVVSVALLAVAFVSMRRRDVA
jgi:ABC-2 type transport system permease protein